MLSTPDDAARQQPKSAHWALDAASAAAAADPGWSPCATSSTTRAAARPAPIEVPGATCTRVQLAVTAANLSQTEICSGNVGGLAAGTMTSLMTAKHGKRAECHGFVREQHGISARRSCSIAMLWRRGQKRKSVPSSGGKFASRADMAAVVAAMLAAAASDSSGPTSGISAWDNSGGSGWYMSYDSIC